MNHRKPTSAPPGVGWALPCLALLLLPLLAADRAWSRPVVTFVDPQDVAAPEPTPYLTTVGSPGLRFLEADPPPDLVTRPPAAAPPHPAEETAAAKPDVIPFNPPETHPAVPVVVAPVAATPANPATEAQPRATAPILPDELRPRVRAEDFLPYFQLPASQPGDPNVIVPVPRSAAAPAPLPPSSATYTQSPK